MAITGIGYGRTLMYETQKRANGADGADLGSMANTGLRFADTMDTENTEDDTLAPVTRGVRLARRIEGKDKVPYGEMAEDGVIEYNGVVFVCDYEHNRITLGDTTNEKDCINIPLSGGGSLLVNRDNIGALSKAIGMFSPEDVNRILRALAQDKKIQEMKKELDDMENGDEPADTDKTDAEKAADAAKEQAEKTEEETQDNSLTAQIRAKMQEIYDKMQNGDTETKFQIGNQEFTLKEWDHFLEKFDSVQDAIREALEDRIEKQDEKRLEEERLDRQEEEHERSNLEISGIPEEIFRRLF